jgi:sugar phosphate isomerase/epimerase
MSTLACPAWTLEHAADAAMDLGYQGIELRLIDGDVITPALMRENRYRLRRIFGPGRLDLIGLGTSVRFTSPDAEQRRAQDSDLREFIELARELGAYSVRIFGGNISPESTEADAISWVAQGLANCAPAAEAAGVKLALETHDDFSRSDRVAAALQRVTSPAVGALWDVHHPYRMGESVAETWVNLAGRLTHLHLKDARRRTDGGWDLVLLGDGEVPCREILRALAMRGYAGYVVVEWEKKWHPEIAEPEIALPQHLAKIREWLADVP